MQRGGKMQEKINQIKISVRNLVEFILCSGNIDNTRGRSDVEAMQAGSRIHRKIQKQMGANYMAEVPLSITIPLIVKELTFELTIDGRADGIISNLEAEETYENLVLEGMMAERPEYTIDEIKGVYFDVSHMTEPIQVHKAQAMCYGYIYGTQNGLSGIEIQITYCNIETETIKRFQETLTMEELTTWFTHLVDEYGKWAAWQIKWTEERNQLIKQTTFPFPYREGQKDLVAGAYRTILRKKNLFIEAPTGVGKTISALFPAVKAMGENITEKIFYLTAKTITRTVAEETFKILKDQGLPLKVATITAKDKVCVLDKPECNPGACERAKGHYDRVNDAVYDLITHEHEITRDLISQYAEKHMVCPFEMSLDVTLWCDGVICDYNYVFDPNVYLRRFFANEKKNDYVFLIDEAHNLVERGREMFSAVLYKDRFLEVKRIVKDKSARLSKELDGCNKELLLLRRECDEFELVERIDGLYLHLLKLMGEYEIFLQERFIGEGKEEVLALYLDVRHFMNMYEIHDENYRIYTDYEDDQFRVKLQCMDPSRNLARCMDRGRSAILFSATLLPIQYYMEQLGGTKEDYAIYAPSSFPTENRLIMLSNDVSTKYSRRNEREYHKIIQYIKEFTEARTGNYMVFFPSYQMLQVIAELAVDELQGIVIQTNSMSELERETFLEEFIEDPVETRIGFCVMGGIFSEGIDLKGNRLIGAVIVGTGLPMVCNERELFRGYFDEVNGKGFDYAYLYQGMNKVLQSAGRVIRTGEDQGAILLLDDRFVSPQYMELFPREWFPNVTVNQYSMKEVLSNFWRTVDQGSNEDASLE